MVTYGTPPQRNKSNRVDWAALLAELSERPGRWAKVSTDTVDASHHRARRLRNADDPKTPPAAAALRAKGYRIEADAIGDGYASGTATLWLRVIAPSAPPSTPPATRRVGDLDGPSD